MPYRRTYSRRNRFTKKRSYKRKARGGGSSLVSSLGRVGLNLLKAKLGLNTEMHWYDVLDTNTATSSSCATMANPILIPIGDTVNTRTGNSVRLVSYQLKGRIQANTAATTGCLVRVFVVKFKYIRGTAPSASNFLDSASQITSPYNMGDAAAAGGYTVLYDRTFSVSVNGQDGDTHQFGFTYKPLTHHLKWDSSDTTGALTSLTDGYIRGFIMTSETGANPPNFWANHRVRFVDN